MWLQSTLGKRIIQIHSVVNSSDVQPSTQLSKAEMIGRLIDRQKINQQLF